MVKRSRGGKPLHSPLQYHWSCTRSIIATAAEAASRPFSVRIIRYVEWFRAASRPYRLFIVELHCRYFEAHEFLERRREENLEAVDSGGGRVIARRFASTSIQIMRTPPERLLTQFLHLHVT